MQLVGLLVVALIALAVMGRFGGGFQPSPARKGPLPSDTLHQVEKQVEAAGQAEQQRLNDAMRQLR